MLSIDCLGRCPYSNGVVEAKGIQDVLGRLLNVKGSAPPDGGNGVGVPKVRQVKPNLILTIRQPAPDLGKPITMAGTGDVGGVVGKCSMPGRVGQMLLPGTGWLTLGGGKEGQRARGDEELLGAAP